MALASIPKAIGKTWFSWLVNFLVIFVLVGDAVPGINESHYLPKAKHAWDSSYAPGDLFLESANAHGLFSFFAGNLAKWMPLTAVAWFGRAGCWALAAGAWTSFAASIQLPRVSSPFVLASWTLAIAWGNWAGEWAVGGFEAKSVSYPLVLLALAAMALTRWSMVWIWLGAATAWHPLVGGWAGLSVAVTWLLFFRSQAPLTRHLLAICLGGALALIGIVPAALGLSGPSADGKVVAAQIHAFLRLAHHQTPHFFAPERHVAAVANLALLALASSLVARSTRNKLYRQSPLLPPVDRREFIDFRTRGVVGLIAVAWVSVAISILGLAIDLLLSQIRPSLAASLLRFYWFRWSDVAVPIGWTVAMWAWASAHDWSPTEISREGKRGGFTVRRLCLAVLAIVSFSGIGWAYIERSRSSVPPADRRLMPDFVAKSPEIEELVFEDWKDVCRWIAANSPNESLWLTPRFQQTFKWYSGRAEVVSWKDVPQDNRSLFEWYYRYLATTPPKDSRGQLRGWTTAELVALSKRFGFTWILVDRRIQKEPPAFEMLYPKVRSVGPTQIAENRTYAVFRVPAGVLTK